MSLTVYVPSFFKPNLLSVFFFFQLSIHWILTAALQLKTLHSVLWVTRQNPPVLTVLNTQSLYPVTSFSGLFRPWGVSWACLYNSSISSACWPGSAARRGHRVSSQTLMASICLLLLSKDWRSWSTVHLLLLGVHFSPYTYHWILKRKTKEQTKTQRLRCFSVEMVQ